MKEANVLVARAFADLATISVLQQLAATDSQRVNEQLTPSPDEPHPDRAGQRRVERAGIDMPEAFSRLRTYARDHNLRLTDVAQSAIDDTLEPDALAPPPPSTGT